VPDPHVAQPPVPPPPPPTPPPTPGAGPRARAPWVAATVAGLVALAAVVALVVVLVTGDDQGDGGASDRGGDDGSGRDVDGGSERGFGSPEEAVTFLVDRLADGQAGEAAEAFAVGPVVEGYSFEAQAERLRAVTFSTWLPGGSGGYDEINEDVRRGEVAVELRSLIRSVLVPDRDQTTTTPLGDDQTAADLAEELSPEPLSELAVARVDEIDRSDAAYRETLEKQGAIYDADELRMVGMLLDTAEGQVMGGATLVRYDDEWAVLSLTAPILDIPSARLVAATEQDYLDAVESARGSDG
jgi:hypothetical protein